MSLKNISIAIIIFLYILLFELSPFFELAGLNYLIVVKNMLIIAICSILFILNNERKVELPWYAISFSAILLFLIIIEFVFCIASDILSPLLGLIEFLSVAIYADRRFIRYFYRCIILVTLVSSIPLLYYYYIFGYYARTDIVFDKSMQTFLFGFSLISLLSEFFYTHSKHKGIIIIIALYLFVCNVYILQSKTSIFVTLVVLFMIFIFRKDNLINILSKYSKQILLVLFILPFLPINWEIPQTLQQAANKLTGRTVFILEKQIREDTYEIRDRILNRTLEVLSDNPLWGAGFGNQEKVLNITGTGVAQGESQIMDLVLDGGITYLVAFLILIIPMACFSINSLNGKQSRYADEFVLFQTTGFFILCIGNEMLSSIGWFFLGSLVYLRKDRFIFLLFSNPRQKILKLVKR